MYIFHKVKQPFFKCTCPGGYGIIRIYHESEGGIEKLVRRIIGITMVILRDRGSSVVSALASCARGHRFDPWSQ